MVYLHFYYNKEIKIELFKKEYIDLKDKPFKSVI